MGGDSANSMGANLTPLDFGPDFNLSAMSNGGGGQNNHHCVVADDMAFKCFGRNNYGQLGLGDTETRGDEPDEMGAALLFVQFAITTSQPTREPIHNPTREQTTNEPTQLPSRIPSAQTVTVTETPSIQPSVRPTGPPSTTNDADKLLSYVHCIVLVCFC